MSVRNLDAIFKPHTVAVIGASTHEHTVGNFLVRNLLDGGFKGAIFPVNPAHTSVCGLTCYPDISSLPGVPDLAVICTPAASVPALIAKLGENGTKGAIVISAGFKELPGAEGAGLEQQILDAAQPHMLRIVGPNCLGVLSTPSSLNASFAHIQPAKGGIAFVTQSGAMLTTLLDWAADRNVGFSHMVSLGDMADVDLGDMLEYLAADPDTKAILLYVEAITLARKFMSAARAAARLKPVIVIKSGRHAASAKAATSHTGALAGVDAVYDVAFKRAGLLRVQTLEELFDAAEILGKNNLPPGERIAILTNGGGVGVLATDALLDMDAKLAELSAETRAALDAILPRTWSRANPIDIIGDAPAERYAAALGLLLSAPEIDWVLVQHCPTAVSSGVEAAKAVIRTASGAGKAIIANWLGAHATHEPQELFSQAGFPSYSTPDDAARGFTHVMRFRRAQEMLLEAPGTALPDFVPDRQKAAGLLKAARERNDSWLSFAEVDEILRCYGIAMPGAAFAADVGGVEAAARSLRGPLVLKIQSPDIVHKSDVAGVAMGLADGKAATKAAEDMSAHIAQLLPTARITGFLLQETIDVRHGIELIVGMTVDPTFGPVMLFGHGGKSVEVINDRALALPPLNAALARNLIERTRVFRELSGYRDEPPMDIGGIIATLLKMSLLVCDLPDIAEIEINPLVAKKDGIVALDARLRLRNAAERMGGQLAIGPCP